MALPAPAVAGDGGGVAAPGRQHAKKRQATTPAKGPSGGVQPVRATLLTSFDLRRKHLFLYGRAGRLVFTLSGRRATSVRIHVLRASDRSRVSSLDLGERAAGRYSIPFTGTEAGVLPEGRYLLHIAGRRLRRGPAASSTAELDFRHHVFPLAGSFDWGNEGSRFGARRKGHLHQGHDLAAAEGTPVVAPRGGLVKAVGYQRGGAGHYLVVDGATESRDYVFMHLRSGSIPVSTGDPVRTGQLVGEVGNTGRSFGAHLHFEIWVGGWFSGGAPVDPLPFLQAWAA